LWVASNVSAEAGVRKVIIAVPAKGEDITVCMGVNREQYTPDQ
jgi:glyceraldehyde 3-phosphate dehydrogenase